MDEPIDSSECHGLVGEDLAPLAEGLVCSNEERSALVSGGDQLEEDAGLGLVFGDVGDVVENEQVEEVEPGDGGLERQLAAGGLEALPEVGGSPGGDAP